MWRTAAASHLASCNPASCILHPVASHPASGCKASCILHPASGWLVAGWWLAGGWLVVGWWLVGWWLVVGGWLVVGTRRRNATLGECSFAAGCWLLVAGRRKVARNATILLCSVSVYKTTFRPTTRLLLVRRKAYTFHLFDTFLKNIFGVNTL